MITNRVKMTAMSLSYRYCNLNLGVDGINRIRVKFIQIFKFQSPFFRDERLLIAFFSTGCCSPTHIMRYRLIDNCFFGIKAEPYC